MEQNPPSESEDDELCIRCFLPRSERHHASSTSMPEGWHVFCGQNYLNDIENALLFVRENKQIHKWENTGVTIDTCESFSEMRCKVCRGINWGGKEDGICFGNSNAEKAVIAAHNRRAHNIWLEAWEAKHARREQ